jgi:L-lactate utilization protein LutB
VLSIVQTLEPAEVDFPFQGTVRLRALEGGAVVETDAETTRDRYLAALAALTRLWQDAALRRGGRFLRATTADDPVSVVRAIVEAVR